MTAPSHLSIERRTERRTHMAHIGHALGGDMSPIDDARDLALRGEQAVERDRSGQPRHRGHDGRRPVCAAARRLDRRHGHGAGARRQPGRHRHARRPGPDGPLRAVVAQRRVLVHGHLLRHRQRHPRGARPVHAHRRPVRRFDPSAHRRQRLADAARPGRPALLERPVAPGRHRGRAVPNDPRRRGGGGRLPGVRGAACGSHRRVAARRAPGAETVRGSHSGRRHPGR